VAARYIQQNIELFQDPNGLGKKAMFAKHRSIPKKKKRSSAQYQYCHFPVWDIDETQVQDCGSPLVDVLNTLRRFDSVEESSRNRLSLPSLHHQLGGQIGRDATNKEVVGVSLDEINMLVDFSIRLRNAGMTGRVMDGGAAIMFYCTW
jgi:hypothetical protein